MEIRCRAVFAEVGAQQPPQTPGQRAIDDLFANNPAAARALQEVILRALQGDVTAADVLAQQLDQALVANAVEEPVRSLIRNTSLQNLLMLQSGGVPSDPVTAALQKQLLSITAEGTTNPLLQRQFREQKDVLQNRMFRAQGPQWGMTTPGIDAASKLQESQAIQTYNDYLATVGALTGPYQAGTAQEMNASTGLSQLGLVNVPATVSALTGIVNPSAIGGVEATNRAVGASQTQQDYAALLSAFQAQQAQAGLGKSIADLVGRATSNAFRLAA